MDEHALRGNLTSIQSEELRGHLSEKMPEARLELAQGFNSPTDFKSGASADSATRALNRRQRNLREEWRRLAIIIFLDWKPVLSQFTVNYKSKIEARGGIEPPISVLQTDALPLCYRAELIGSKGVERLDIGALKNISVQKVSTFSPKPHSLTQFVPTHDHECFSLHSKTPAKENKPINKRPTRGLNHEA